MILPIVPTPARTTALETGSGRSAATAVSPALTVSQSGNRLVLSATALAARDMSGGAPVDAARVAALKSQIDAGTYVTDPGRIADAMIALDLPGR